MVKTIICLFEALNVSLKLITLRFLNIWIYSDFNKKSSAFSPDTFFFIVCSMFIKKYPMLDPLLMYPSIPLVSKNDKTSMFF